MVEMPSSIRNLTQHPENISPSLAIAVDAVTHSASPKTSQASEAIGALSDLLNGNTWDTDDSNVHVVSQTDRYETDGYPDRLAMLYALISRPVGKGVHYRTRTVTVDTPEGQVVTQESEAEYYDRPLTEEERRYLDQQDRLKRLRPRPGDIDWLTKPNMRDA